MYSTCQRVARIFRGGGVRFENEDTCKLVGGSEACSPGKILETLKCLGLHFTRFHGREREKDKVE